jgi:CheY-like chemotaxis protein
MQTEVRTACSILVVDDDLGIRSALAAFLEDAGYLVEEAANGREALTWLERQHPTLVLLDMRMPVMDGWEFARALRARRIAVPLVVMTAARDAQAWAEEIAAEAYVSKPFDYDVLLSTVERICDEQGS